MSRNEPSPFADRLVRLRRLKRWTQEQLAERAGVSLGIVSSLEQGVRQDPRLSTVLKLARALGASLDQLVDVADVAEVAEVAE
jgi:transcriptional regulator with XRE-family HTH domain